MFDIGFSELLLFGVIALIVLGPEKLPKAARTAGQWYAKIRRTVSTLQAEIEAEFDLAETRQQMQSELAKIRQTEADMRREMAEMRGSLKEFKQSQNQHSSTESQRAKSSKKPSPTQDDSIQNRPAEFAYAYEQELELNQESMSHYSPHGDNPKALETDTDSLVDPSVNHNVNPIMTRPWENMWFRLGAYDKARRLPSAPRLPNYKADVLLYSHLNKPVPNKTILNTGLNAEPNTETSIKTSLDKQEVDK